MSRFVTGIAALALIGAATLSPASAAERHAGIAKTQSTDVSSQRHWRHHGFRHHGYRHYGYRHWRRYWGPRYGYYGYPYRYRYGYYGYPYRYYHRPGFAFHVGPFGFGFY